jgi:6-phosphogluconolactonase
MMNLMRMIWHLSALLLTLAPLAAAAEYFVYVGTYTNTGKSQGIYAYRFDSNTGKLTDIGLAGQATNPSFVNISPNHKYLYAVSEVSGPKGQPAGTVTAFSIDAKTAKLTPLNQVPSRGSGPCYVSIDKTGKAALVANYNSGSVALMPVKADGSLGEATAFDQREGKGADPRRQSGPHAHSIFASPDNRFALSADLGLDRLYVYKLDPAAGTLAPNDPPYANVKPGGGPRHFDFHPNGKFVYVIHEMGSAVTAFSYDKARGAMSEVQTVSTLPADYKGENNCADIHVHRSGKFLYGSNRGHDSIAVFAVDARKGTLKLIDNTSTQGKVPRNFGIDPTGKFLIAANQNTNNLVVFRIDQKTGKLTPAGQSVEVGAPVCVQFMPLK